MAMHTGKDSMGLSRQPDSLIILLTVVRENHAERKKLIQILDLDSLHRKMAVNFLVMQMRQEHAPEEFVDAWDSLQDDDVAERAKQLIEDGTLEERTHRWSILLIFLGTAAGLGMLIGLYWMIR